VEGSLSKQRGSRSQDHNRTSECSDEEFVSDLGLPLHSPEARVALAIRSTIADLADMPDRSLYAHHTFVENVRGRGMFDDSLDTVEFIMTLEEKLGMRIPTPIAEKLPGVLELDFPHPLYTIADAVAAMASYLVDAGIMAQ
jgi:acyl carrier protein